MLRFLLRLFAPIDVRRSQKVFSEIHELLILALKEGGFQTSTIPESGYRALVNLAVQRIEKRGQKVTMANIDEEFSKVAEVVRLLPKGFGEDTEENNVLMIMGINIYKKRG